MSKQKKSSGSAVFRKRLFWEGFFGRCDHKI